MKGRTHINIGNAITIGAFTWVAMNHIAVPFEMNLTSFVSLLVGSTIGSLLPDNDTKNTTISKFLPISNRIITWLASKNVKAFYHRHLLHSLFCLPVLALLLAYYGQSFQYSELIVPAAFGLFIGTAAHVLADSFLSNTWIFYPIIRKPVSLCRLSLEKNEKIYKGLEKTCNFIAICATVFLIGSLVA